MIDDLKYIYRTCVAASMVLIGFTSVEATVFVQSL